MKCLVKFSKDGKTVENIVNYPCEPIPGDLLPFKFPTHSEMNGVFQLKARQPVFGTLGKYAIVLHAEWVHGFNESPKNL